MAYGGDTPGSPSARDGGHNDRSRDTGRDRDTGGRDTGSSHPRANNDATPTAPDHGRDRTSGDRDLNPNASDRLKDAVKGGDANPSSSQSGGLESIRGSKNARFAFNNPSARGMKQLGRNVRDRGLDGVGSMEQGGSLGGISSGDIAGGDGLDRTTEAYDTIVGEKSPTRTKREIGNQRRDRHTPQVRNAADRRSFNASRTAVDEATDDHAVREGLLGMVPGLNLAVDMAENKAAADQYNEKLDQAASDLSLEEGYYNRPGMVDATDAAMGNSTGNIIGNRDRMHEIAMGTEEQRADPRDIGGGDLTGGKTPGILKNKLRPKPQIKPGPNQPSQKDSGFGVGRITNYGSYRRRVLNNS